MNSKPHLIGIAPSFVVDDVVRTAEYYRDVFGFKILGYFLDPPVFAMVGRDSVQIHFGKADLDGPSPNARRRNITCDAYIWVPEIDAMYEELKSRQADIVEGVVKRIYGSREIVVRDCNGFTIVFGD